MMKGEGVRQPESHRWMMLLVSVGIVGYLGVLRVFQPLFTDEITYFLMANRYLAEGNDLWRFIPDCSPRPLTVGWMLYPFYVIRSLLAGAAHSPYSLIISSFVQALSFVGICYALSAIGSADERPLRRLLRLAPLGLGAFPAYLLLGRPEMSALVIIGLQLLLVASEDRVSLHWEVRPLASVILAGVLCSHHPQMIVFLPLCIASAWWRRTPAWSIVCMVSIGIIGVQTYQVGESVRRCPDRPAVHQLFAQVTLQTAEIVHHPIETIGLFLRNIQNSFVLFNGLFVDELTGVVFPYVYRFLPPWVGAIWRVPVVLFPIFLLLGILAGVYEVLIPLRKGQQPTRHQYSLVLTLGCLMIWAGMRGPKMWYLVVLVYGIIALLWMQLSPHLHSRWVFVGMRRLLTVVGVGLMSMSCLVNLFCLIGSDHSPIRGSSVPTGVFPEDLPSLTRDISQLVQLCGLPQDRSHMTLVTDDYSSLVLWDVLHQLHATYYTVWAPDLQDPLVYLTGMGAWGFVGSCSGYEALYGTTPVRVGSLCCQQYKSSNGSAL